MRPEVLFLNPFLFFETLKNESSKILNKMMKALGDPDLFKSSCHVFKVLDFVTGFHNRSDGFKLSYSELPSFLNQFGDVTLHKTLSLYPLFSDLCNEKHPPTTDEDFFLIFRWYLGKDIGTKEISKTPIIPMWNLFFKIKENQDHLNFIIE